MLDQLWPISTVILGVLLFGSWIEMENLKREARMRPKAPWNFLKGEQRKAQVTHKTGFWGKVILALAIFVLVKHYGPAIKDKIESLLGGSNA